MRRTYKYRAYANKQTVANAENWLELCRHLYNVALEERITAYKMNHINLSQYDQQNELPDFKRTFPEYSLVDSQVLQRIIWRLSMSYKQFFKCGVGFPRFKSKERFDSFLMEQSSWKLSGKYLSIRNVGRFKLKLSRPIEGVIKTVTIRRDAGKWYVTFSCDQVPAKPLSTTGKAIGLDVGIKSFLVDSEGNNVNNPQFFRKSQAQLRRRQRRLARRVKGSQGRRQTRLSVAKVHLKVRNQRQDWLHKVANYYIENYDLIAVEDLNIKGMVKNHCLAKSITDSSWGIFIQLLTEKAEGAARQVVKVPRFEPTSKTCSECGSIKADLTLSDRTWVCQSCGAVHDRDYNAAKNILKVGQTLQASTCGNSQSVACESQLRVPTLVRKIRLSQGFVERSNA